MKEDRVSTDFKKETNERFIYAYEHRLDNLNQFHDMLYFLAIIRELNKDIENIEIITAKEIYSIVKL